MRSLARILTAVQDLANTFDGTVSIKNAERKYFYVNQAWLDIMKMQMSDVIGRRDDEIVPKENADFIRKTDLEAAEKGCPIQYTNIAKVAGSMIKYTAIKWVVFYQQTHEPFCYCTIAHLDENKEKVIELQSRINTILLTEVYEQTDYTESSDDS